MNLRDLLRTSFRPHNNEGESGDDDKSIVNPPAGGGDAVDDNLPKDNPPKEDPPKDNDPVDPKKFLDYLPEDLKGNDKLQRIKSLEDLAKGYVEAQNTISSTGRVPKEDASQEEWDAFYERIGVPKTSDGYELSLEEEYTKDENIKLELEEEQLKKFKEFAKEKRLTKEQAQAQLNFYAQLESERLKQQNEKIETEMADSIQDLKREWRGNYQNNIDKISTNLTRLFDEPTTEKLKESGLLRDANFLKNLLPLTNMATGDTVYIDGNPVQDVSNSLQSLEKKRDELMQEDYRKNNNRVQELNKQIADLKNQQAQAMRKRRG